MFVLRDKIKSSEIIFVLVFVRISFCSVKVFAHAASIIRIVLFRLTGFGSVGSVTSYQLIGLNWFQNKPLWQNRHGISPI